MKPPLQFRIKNYAGTYYYVSGNDVLPSATPKEIDPATPEWNKLNLLYVRNAKHWGIFRKQAPDKVTFVKDGAKIIRYLENTQGGPEAKFYLEILKLKSIDQQYYSLGDYAIDFSEISSGKDSVSVALMDGGLSALVNAFGSTLQSLSIGDPDPGADDPDPDASYVWMDSINLEGQFNYETEAGGTTSIVMNNLGDTAATSIVGTASVDQEGEYGVAITNSVICDDTGSDSALAGDFQQKWTFGVVKAGTYTLSFDNFVLDDIAWDAANAQDSLFLISAQVFATADFSTPLIAGGHTFWASGYQPGATVLFPGSIPMVPLTFNYPVGSYLVIYFKTKVMTPLAYTEVNHVVCHLPVLPNKSHIKYIYTPFATPCRALSHFSAFKKLFQKISGTALDPVSDLLTSTNNYFDVKPLYTFFTSGDAIRQLYLTADGQLSNPQIVTTLDDFAKDAFVSLGAGLGIEKDGLGNEVLRLEHLSHFLQAGVLIKDLGNKITNFEKTRFTEHLGNSINIGYDDNTYDDINGRFEYNSEAVFKTSNTRVQRNLEYRSPYRHDGYGAELTRINLKNKQTTDSQSDNEIFKLQSSGTHLSTGATGVSPYAFQLQRSFLPLTGLPASVMNTVFNLPFTPIRQMYRLLRFLKSNFYGLLDQVITWETSKKNVITSSSSTPYGPFDEKENIDLTTAPGTLMYKPYLFSFTAEAPMDLIDLMETTPNGVFRFTYKGYVLEGFVMEAGINPAERDTYNFKLLCSPDTVIPDDI